MELTGLFAGREMAEKAMDALMLAVQQAYDEAVLFAAHIILPDDEIPEYIIRDHDAAQIARAMNPDINLVALKVSELSGRGYSFRKLEHKNDFLK